MYSYVISLCASIYRCICVEAFSPCSGERDVQRANFGRNYFLFETQATLYLQLCGHHEIYRCTAHLTIYMYYVYSSLRMIKYGSNKAL